ncbi:hypothetical protein O5833_28025, partial [Escherichia coli]|nr:hypothetical protein [Escherichia coli]
KVRNWHHISLCKIPRKSARFYLKKPFIDKVHGFACVFLPHFLQTAPFPARSERVSETALKPPRKAGGRGGVLI